MTLEMMVKFYEAGFISYDTLLQFITVDMNNSLSEGGQGVPFAWLQKVRAKCNKL